MTIESEVIRNDYTADGIETTFAFEFIIYDQEHITVYVDGTLQAVDVDFTIAEECIEADDGGNVVFVDPPADGAVVNIISNAPYMQMTSLPTRNHTYEDTYDKAVILIKQLREALSRCLSLPASSSTSDIELPEPIAEYHLRWTEALDALENVFVPEFPDPVANYYLRWKSDLSGLENVAPSNVSGQNFILSDVRITITDGALIGSGPANYIIDPGVGGGFLCTEGGVDISTEGGVLIITEGGEECEVTRVGGITPGYLFTLTALYDNVVIKAGDDLKLAGGMDCYLTPDDMMTFRMGSGGVAYEMSRSSNA